MARTLGSWWIKDGIDGRRIEAQGFASLLDGLSGYDWTEDHGDSDVLEKDFVETANYTEKVDNVDAVMMSSHGNPNSFSVWNGSVSTSDTVKFGKSDLEIFATHACSLLEHTPTNSVGRWIPAFDRLHYMFGFHTARTAAAARTRAGSTSRCTPPGCTPCSRSSRSTRSGSPGRRRTSSSRAPMSSGRTCAAPARRRRQPRRHLQRDCSIRPSPATRPRTVPSGRRTGRAERRTRWHSN